MPILNMCKQEHPNMVVKIDTHWNYNNFIDLLKEAGIPFFYSDYFTKSDEIYWAIGKGVTDVYITEGLCFDIGDIGKYCREKGVKVRVIPNIAQHAVGCKDGVPDPLKFFIRPEDVRQYEDSIDILELIADTGQNALYEIYRNGEWRGNLDTLIVGLEDTIYNRSMNPIFGLMRINCHHKCMYGKCRFCLDAVELAELFANNKLAITRPINKEWKNETESYKEIVQSLSGTASESNDEVSEEQRV
jgi:hypothetical protein